MSQLTYSDVKKDAALLVSYWKLGGEKGQQEGQELIELMHEVDGQQHADRVVQFALTLEGRQVH